MPYERLSPDALRALVEAFVLEEGTDYGHTEPTLDEKRGQVQRQLEAGRVVVVFDPRTEQVTLCTYDALPAGARADADRDRAARRG